jgi:hypothetical protein
LINLIDFQLTAQGGVHYLPGALFFTNQQLSKLLYNSVFSQSSHLVIFIICYQIARCLSSKHLPQAFAM